MATRTQLPAAPWPAAVAGLRRIEQVRVIVGRGRPVAEVTGTGHRCPHTFRISMATALQLADAGIPMRIEFADDAARRAGQSSSPRSWLMPRI